VECLSDRTPSFVGIAVVVCGLLLLFPLDSAVWAGSLREPPTVPKCSAADLRRPLPPMPQPKRVLTKYVVTNQSHINPAPNIRPSVTARSAWLAARAYLTSWNPPGGGTASLLFGRVMSTNTVPSTKRLAWVAVLHHTALKVHGTTTLPCQFFQVYAAIDARTGKAFIGAAQALLTG
jgi:hypothetical protein